MQCLVYEITISMLIILLCPHPFICWWYITVVCGSERAVPQCTLISPELCTQDNSTNTSTWFTDKQPITLSPGTAKKYIVTNGLGTRKNACKYLSNGKDGILLHCFWWCWFSIILRDVSLNLGMKIWLIFDMTARGIRVNSKVILTSPWKKTHDINIKRQIYDLLLFANTQCWWWLPLLVKVTVSETEFWVFVKHVKCHHPCYHCYNSAYCHHSSWSWCPTLQWMYSYCTQHI